MADKRKTTKKTTRSTRSTAKTRAVSETKPARKQKSLLNDVFRFGESYTSLVLGIIVVIAVASLLVTFSRNHNSPPEAPKQDTSSTSTRQSDIASPGSTYIVREGDDLWQIAEKAYGDGHRFTEIVKANNIQDPNRLTAGTTLRIPDTSIVGNTSPTNEIAQQITATVTPGATLTAVPTSAPTRMPTAMATPTPTVAQQPNTTGPPAGSRYTVKAGDTLWDISVRTYGNGYRWGEIAKANNLQNPDLIFPGNTFNLPK